MVKVVVLLTLGINDAFSLAGGRNWEGQGWGELV